jgi:putative molybdopterin biosynthesis protein
VDTELLKPDEMADVLKISRAKAYTMLRRGEIPAVRIGSLVRVRRSDLERYILERETTNPSGQASAE